MPNVIASGPVIIENNKVLLVKHGADDFWKFCGGRQEPGDADFLATAKREAREELGIELEIIDPKPFIIKTTKPDAAATIDITLVHFLAKRNGDIKPGKETREWRWLEIEKIKSENLAPNIIPTLKHFGFIK